MVTIVQHRVVDVRGCIPSDQDSNYGDAGQVRYPSWGRMVCACRGMAQQGHEMDRASVSRVRTELHEDETMELRGNAGLWLPLAFAAIVSEATPMSSLRELRESLQQMNFKLLAFDMPHGITEHSISGVIQLTVAYFPVLQAVVVVGALGAYLAATRTFSLRGFLWGLPTGHLVLSFGYAGVIALLIFSTLHLPQPIFYYLVLRLPMFLGLVLALWIALRPKNAEQQRVRQVGARA